MHGSQAGHGHGHGHGRATLRTQPTTISKIGQRQQKPTWIHPTFLKITRSIVEHRLFSLLTALLTIYALTGDDMRLIFTHQPADPVFDGLTLLCIVVFVLEIVLCMFAKDDYFLSFFFVLDVISTVTLVIDLTWVNDSLQGSEEDMSNDRVSGTAKIGTRTSRVVRVLRLIRIIKLYKAIYEARQLQKKKEEIAKQATMDTQLYPGNEDDDDSYDDMEVQQASMTRVPGKESRVGKKLSEKTTRRVILLVLVMMLVLPYLKVEDAQQFPTSAGYGADIINEAFNQYLESNTTEDKTKYDKALLQYVYYHNWFTKQLPTGCPFDTSDCAVNFDSHVFWVGFVGKNQSVLLDRASKARVDSSSVSDMETLVTSTMQSKSTAWIYIFGHMPAKVQTILSLSWSNNCPLQSDSSDRKRRGISILEETFTEDPWNVDYAVPCPENLRRAERKKYTPRLNVASSEFEELHFAFYFDLRPFVKQESLFNLLTVLFVCIMLLLASIGFANDANRLVLYPVENMIAKVETIRNNPLQAMKVADEEFKVEEINRAKAAKQEKSRLQVVMEWTGCSSKKDNTEIMETVILEKTIIKLGSLLALGFGEAGANIIEHNMHGVDSACVDAMVEGTRVECIIGATRIRDFSTATEVLQAKVMTFVNQIAEIVHGVVDEFHGAANKNNGDTFLMIWRMGDIDKVSKLADMSILAFTRILGAIHRTPVLAAYRGHPGLQQRLGKDCRVNLSSGLHYGWAIEGAVGSEFKIDASYPSYLSPNVSIAETVERATQIYGVSVLVAESVVSICSTPMATKCRLIDRVIITGSVVPMDLYVIDLDYLGLTVEQPLGPQRWTTRDRFKVTTILGK